MKGLFIPEITAEMFKNGCLESIEALMAEGEIYDIDYPLEQQPCEDCISRKAVISIIDCHKNLDGNDAIVWIEKEIGELPPVTAQQKTGHWILADEQNKADVMNDNYRFICSECQCSDIQSKSVTVPYCWHCGAEMSYVPDTNDGEMPEAPTSSGLQESEE